MTDYERGYQQGRIDEKKEKEQDAYYRGYCDGQAKCSFENEKRIREDERKRIIEKLQDFAFVNMDETFSLQNMKVMLKTVIEIVNGSEVQNDRFKS